MSRRSRFIAISLFVVAGLGATIWYTRWREPAGGPMGPGAPGAGRTGWAGGRGGKGGKGGPPVPVRVAAVTQGNIDVTLDALGTVTARNSVVVHTRVDGLLEHVRFHEGSEVKANEVLADLDARPYQAALKQAEGQLKRDEALLESARADLARYQTLLEQDSIAKQQVDDQAASVHQYEGIVLGDRGALETARLNLQWTHITAPIAGRVGLRQVDTGNMVHASDANGLVVLTQTQPINVTFAIPADRAPSILSGLRAGTSVTVDAYDRDGKSRLAQGKLESGDNVVDATTNTVKLKALYDNRDGALLPNQFVNARITLETQPGQTLVPAAAILRGTPGTYVYLVGADRTVSVRPVVVGAQNGDVVAVTKGLAPGDQVVVDGTDKLHDGSRIEAAVDAPSPARRRGGWGGHGDHGGRRNGGAAPPSAGAPSTPTTEAAPSAPRDGGGWRRPADAAGGADRPHGPWSGHRPRDTDRTGSGTP